MTENESSETLSELFHQTWLEIRSLNSTFGSEVQDKINKLIPTLNNLLASIDELDIFSLNEDLSDLTPNSIPFLMTHGFLAIVHSKKFTSREERLKQVELSLKHVKEFEMLMIQFGFKTVKFESRENGLKSAESVQIRRKQLIEAQNEQKQLNSQIDAFIQRLNTDPDSIDDDDKRKMYEKAIHSLQFQISSEVENLNMELGFLKNGPPPRPNINKLPPPRKPMIIAKDKMQAKVFGAGYPSIPTMSVEEFAEQEMKAVMPSQEFALFNQQMAAKNARGLKNKNYNVEIEENEKVPSDEDDSEQALYKKRQFDAFKDDNRRGSGNRHNMG